LSRGSAKQALRHQQKQEAHRCLKRIAKGAKDTMKSKLLYEDKGLKTFALVFAKDEQLKPSLTDFAKAHQLSAAQLTGIGAFSEVTLGYFDRATKTYQQIPIREQAELLSLAGNFTLNDGEPKLHAHVVVGKSDGTAHGGHFLAGKVWPTLEMIVAETPAHLRRTQDDETGLALIDLAA
jgi:predicted DNA-binding protein with PD1-like motif